MNTYILFAQTHQLLTFFYFFLFCVIHIYIYRHTPLYICITFFLNHSKVNFRYHDTSPQCQHVSSKNKGMLAPNNHDTITRKKSHVDILPQSPHSRVCNRPPPNFPYSLFNPNPGLNQGSCIAFEWYISLTSFNLEESPYLFFVCHDTDSF